MSDVSDNKITTGLGYRGYHLIIPLQTNTKEYSLLIRVVSPWVMLLQTTRLIAQKFCNSFAHDYVSPCIPPMMKRFGIYFDHIDIYSLYMTSSHSTRFRIQF